MDRLAIMITLMSTSQAFLTSLQWLSPAFPIGSFAYSHGLEWAISEGHVTDEDSLLFWLQDLVALGSGRGDAILVSLAYQVANLKEVNALNEIAIALSPSGERLSETSLQGHAFTRTVKDVWGHDLPDLCYPVAVGYGAKLEGISREDIVAAYLQGFVANLVSAAVRLVPLGQTQGQRLLLALMPDLIQVSTAALTAAACDLTNTAFLSDVASMRHETLQPRVFKT